MSNIDITHVELGERSYDILVGDGLLAEAGDFLAPVMASRRAVIVTDENVAEQYLTLLNATLKKNGISATCIVLPAGEQTKDFSHLENLASRLLDEKIERSTSLIALGGGVIGDLTGFAASIILRGVDFIQIPTTLLAQVDSSVGGKTGINTRHGKNLVGAFYQPKIVLADIATLDTLPQREVLAGYAEVAKYGLINDPAFFEWLEENGKALCRGDKPMRRHAVGVCCRSKAKIVAEDERETGQRALLNLGHTFGHALEAETGFGAKLLHGEAVGIGICMAFDLSAQMDLCSVEDADRIRRHYSSVGLPVGPLEIEDVPWQTATLIGHMAADKKVQGGLTTFILAMGIGEAFVTQNVELEDLQDVINKALAA